MIIKENTSEKVSNASEVAKVLTAILAKDSEIDRDKEHLWSIGLNTKNVIKFVDLVSLGTLTGSLVGPREFFRLAVKKGVANIIIIILPVILPRAVTTSRLQTDSKTPER